MKVVAPHMNLLREDEILSSSPFRLRVMGPVLTALACAACLVWWGVIGMQAMIVNGAITSLRAELDSKKAAHAEILAQMAAARERSSQLEQLGLYVAGRRAYGPFLARFAEIFPENAQLLMLVLPEPAPQNLQNPLGPKAPPLLGPTDPAEPTSVRILGRTKEAEPVHALMRCLRGDEFTNVLVRVAEADAYPKIHAFRQEAATGGDSERLLQFDLEFRGADRRFAK